MPRQYFAFRFEWMDAVQHLGGVVRLEVYEAAVHYAMTGERVEMSARAAEAFETFVLPVFLRRKKAAEYRARRKERLAALAADASEQQIEALETRPVRIEGADATTATMSLADRLKIYPQAPPSLIAKVF